MRKRGRKAKQPQVEEQLAPIGVEKKTEKQEEIAFEVWEQHVQEDAVKEAGRKEGPLHTRSIETQLQRLSDQVTHEAQEKREHPTTDQ